MGNLPKKGNCDIFFTSGDYRALNLSLQEGISRFVFILITGISVGKGVQYLGTTEAKLL